jgi:predicted SprT family Zn-dependent metalloprotease
VNKQRIRIYAPWQEETPLEEIAIHEYAHHIHYTEQNKVENKERPHGAQFWEIYGALMCVAVQKRLFNEERVSRISNQAMKCKK